MKKCKRLLVVAITIMLVMPLAAHAQVEQDEAEAAVVETYRYGAGFQGSFPASGLSGMMNITDDIAVQAILGFFGNLRTFAGRGLYKFQEEDFWDLYGYGMIGAWSYQGFAIGNNTRQRETVLGLGAGAGFQYDWRAYNPEFPPISWNIELGIGFVDFNEVNYNFSTIMFGAGVHYRF